MMLCCAVSFSCVQLYATPWTAAHQVPLSMGILQARILEWVTMPSSGASSWPRKQTGVSCIADRFFTSWATREAPRRWCQISWIVPGMGRGSPDCLSTEGQGIHLRSRILKFRVLDLGPRVGWLWQGLNPRKKQVYPRTEWLAMQLEAAVSASRGNFAPF